MTKPLKYHIFIELHNESPFSFHFRSIFVPYSFHFEGEEQLLLGWEAGWGIMFSVRQGKREKKGGQKKKHNIIFSLNFIRKVHQSKQ
jgi:hypothetical protein